MDNDKLLKKVKKMFDHSVDSNQYTRWQAESVKWQDFYEGKQWTEDEIAALEERGQAPIVTNLIAPKVDSLSGVDIQNRTQIAFKPRSFDEEDRVLSEALTAVGQQVQEINELPFKQSQAFKHSLIYGIGWLEMEGDGGKITASHVHPYDMFWDVDDETSLLDDSRYVGRKKWVSFDRAVEMFPEHKKELTNLFDSEREVAENSSVNPMDDPNENRFVDIKKDRLLIVEVQWKESNPLYKYLDETGKQHSTFDEDHAQENKIEGSEVTEEVGDKVYSTIFIDNIVLFHSPLVVQNGEFTYVPLPYKRRDSDKVFVGVVAAGIDAQEEYNKRRSKMLHLLNTQRLFVEGDTEQDIEELAEMVSKPNGVFISKSNSNMRIDSNLDLSQGQFQMLGASATEMQQAMGIFDELLGQQTNATSGVAVARRQQASVRTQSFALDMLSMHKRRVGRVLLKLIQAVMSEPTLVQIGGENGKVQQIVLNDFIESDDGKRTVVNDVATSDFDVVVEEQPDFNAPPQEVAQRLEQVVGNGQLGLLAQMPTVLKQMGFRNVEQVVEEFQQAMQQQQQQQAEAQQQEAAAQAAPVEQQV